MKTFFQSTRFRLIVLVLLAMLPALGLTLYTGLVVRQQAYEKVRIDAMRIVQISGDSYNDTIASGKQLLTGLAQIPQVRQFDAAGCSAVFSKVLSEFPEYTNLAATDPQGNLICSGIELPSPVNIANRDYFKQITQEKTPFSVSNHEVGPETNQGTIVMAHPSLDDLGKVQAVVTASVNLRKLSQTIQMAQLPEHSEFFIIDGEGTLLIRSPDSWLWVGKSVASREIVKSILQKKDEGTFEVQGIDNVERLYAFEPVNDGSRDIAYIAVGIPLAVVYAEANQLLKSNLIFLGIVAILSLSAAWFLGDLLIFRQIQPLLQAAQHWATGNLHVRISKKDGPSEFIQLSEAFDQMVDAIAQREALIRQGEREAVENETRIQIQHAIIGQREEERLKIARDLHDGPVQAITAVTYILYDLQLDNCPAEIARKLDEVRTTLQDQIADLRHYAGELRPTALKKFGIGKAIETHIESFKNRHPELRIRVEENLEGVILPEEVQTALFRIYQELLNNIEKHSRASEVFIRLSHQVDRVVLEIQDNGVGFMVTTDWLELARQGHLGLVGMKERAEAIGGKVRIQSSPRKGSHICVEVPQKS